MNELIVQCAASLRRTRRNFLIVACIILGLAVLLIVSIYTDVTATTGIKIGSWIFAVFLIGLDVLMFSKIFRPDQIIESLKHNPGAILEVQAISIVYKGGKQTYQKNLHFKMADGKTYVLSDNRTKIDAILSLLKQYLKSTKFVG